MTTRRKQKAVEKNWTCQECKKKFGKTSDKLMECEFCEHYFCLTCLNMSDVEYDHHIQSSGMWFCLICKPKVEETLKIEKEIEKRCKEHFEKFKKRLVEIEEKLERKLEKNDVITIIDEKLKDKTITETKCNEKKIIELVKEQVDSKSFAEIVKQVDSVNEQKVLQLVDDKFEENEKEVSDRQNREKNVIIFNMEEPITNIIKERQDKDLMVVNEMIEFMEAENEDEVAVEKIIRIGIRNKNFKEQPRPAIVSFSSLEGKKSFLRNSNVLRQNTNEIIKIVSVANDLTKKDREKEAELMIQKKSKNLAETGPWKYVARGPPGDRKIIRIKKTN